jgi:ABC-type oligopeptide transport system substrate-binding subunit
MRFLLILTASLTFASCGGTSTASGRQPLPPKGSDESNIPWNTPSGPEGAGMLGGLLEGR